MPSQLLSAVCFYESGHVCADLNRYFTAVFLEPALTLRREELQSCPGVVALN